jgi:hypothetical protein
MKLHLKIGTSLLVASISSSTFAEISFGNADTNAGAFTISGGLRANYQHKSFGEPASDEKIQFNAAILNLNYDSLDWFGDAQYRCYQYDNLCDLSMLVYGYAGYKLNSTDQVSLGIQAIPFGPSRFWDSSFYTGINSTMGLQDVLNLGINYHFELPSSTKVDLAYFVTDGGNYTGDTQDAARYTANLVKTLNTDQTDLQEKNMWVGRITQDLNFLNRRDLHVSVGGSYWYSEIENNKSSENGSRKAWSLFNKVTYKNLSIVLTGGKQTIQNKDHLSPESSTIGSFDTEYELANRGYFYTVDSSYLFKDSRGIGITPYFVYSGFDKSEKGFDHSQRNIIGVAWDYKKIALYTEYIVAKNDPFIGGNAASLAQGDDGKWNKMANLMFIYSF